MNRPQNNFWTLHQTPKNVHEGPQKSKITPKLSQNQMSEFKWKLFNYMIRPQKRFVTIPQPQK